MNWVSHSRIYRNLEINFKYENETPLRIGSTKGKSPTSPVDLQVLKILERIPYIPGSSLKGVIRSACERIALSYGISVCYMGEECKNKNDKELKEKIKKIEKKEIAENELLKFLYEKYCLICKLFGSGTFSSHFQFSDAYPKNKVSTGIKTGIAIERKSGSVKREALYTIEYINPNSEFYGSIILNNVPNYGIGLLAEVIEQINEGIIRIGGFKTRGFGKIKMEAIKLNGVEVVNKELKSIKELKELQALDENDIKITFDYKDPNSLLSNSKEAWKNYIKKIKEKK